MPKAEPAKAKKKAEEEQREAKRERNPEQAVDKRKTTAGKKHKEDKGREKVANESRTEAESSMEQPEVFRPSIPPNGKVLVRYIRKFKAAKAPMARGWGNLMDLDDMKNYYYNTPDETFVKAQKVTFVRAPSGRADERRATFAFGVR